jgi:pyruvate/2-oxoglutarate dehydrogenase complex dihydrolipoamide acyltransferase (E2) component
VTTEQELKLAVVAEVVVVDDAVVDELVVVADDALVVGAVLGDVEEEELHAVRRMAAVTATTTPTRPGGNFGFSLIRPLHRIGGCCVRRSVPQGDRRPCVPEWTAP